MKKIQFEPLLFNFLPLGCGVWSVSAQDGVIIKWECAGNTDDEPTTATEVNTPAALPSIVVVVVVVVVVVGTGRRI